MAIDKVLLIKPRLTCVVDIYFSYSLKNTLPVQAAKTM